MSCKRKKCHCKEQFCQYISQAMFHTGQNASLKHLAGNEELLDVYILVNFTHITEGPFFVISLDINPIRSSAT